MIRFLIALTVWLPFALAVRWYFGEAADPAMWTAVIAIFYHDLARVFINGYNGIA